jgi:hypothetical protein
MNGFWSGRTTGWPGASSPGGGGGGGGACAITGQSQPTWTGRLLRGSGGACEPCCKQPAPALVGAQPPCDDDGRGEAGTARNKISGTTGVNQAQGAQSPLELNYGVDLAGLPDNARIFQAISDYGTTGNVSAVSDDVGAVTSLGGGAWVSRWGDDGIAALNDGAGPSVRAQATHTPPPLATFSALSVDVAFTEPVDS